jgi:uncharacterized protein YuzE
MREINYSMMIDRIKSINEEIEIELSKNKKIICMQIVCK